MARKAYVGDTDGTPLLIPKGYIGGNDGKPIRLLKGYVGDKDGLARQFWGSLRMITFTYQTDNTFKDEGDDPADFIKVTLPDGTVAMIEDNEIPTAKVFYGDVIRIYVKNEREESGYVYVNGSIVKDYGEANQYYDFSVTKNITIELEARSPKLSSSPSRNHYGVVKITEQE